MNDFQMDEENQSCPQPEPSTRLGLTSNVPRSNANSATTAPGNMGNVDIRQRPSHFDAAPYGMMHYNGIPHPMAAANRDLGVVTVPNIYNFPGTPSPCNAAPVPHNHGPSDWLQPSNSYGYIRHPGNEHGRNTSFMEHGRGSYKTKIAEGFSGNFQYPNALAGSNAVVGPLNPMHPEGFARIDASYFPLYQYRGNDGPILEARGSNESVGSSSAAIGMDPGRVHNNLHTIHGSYITQPFLPASSNRSDGGASSWNQVPAVPYMPVAGFRGGSMEAGNLGFQRYNEAISSMSYLHPPPMNQRLQALPHPSHPMQGIRGHDFAYHPSTTAPYRVMLNNNANAVMVPRENSVMGPRHPSSGFRIHRAQRRDIAQDTNSRRHLPHLRLLPADNVAILDVPELHEVGIDLHRDLRLDIEDMSYEELLALGERIGSVNTGLSEETISRRLKARTFSTATCVTPDKAACDRKADSCIICQDNYKDQEEIGTLDCGHEYHADCLKKWLMVKNVCPICKSEALPAEKREV